MKKRSMFAEHHTLMDLDLPFCKTKKRRVFGYSIIGTYVYVFNIRLVDRQERKLADLRPKAGEQSSVLSKKRKKNLKIVEVDSPVGPIN